MVDDAPASWWQGKRWWAIGAVILLIIIIVAAETGGDDGTPSSQRSVPTSSQSQATAPASQGFSISGNGNDVRTVNARGQLTCRAEVRGNHDPSFGGGTNFAVWIHGSGEFDGELLANDIGVTVRDSAVVTFGGDSLFALSPPYRVEVDAAGSWTVACR